MYITKTNIIFQTKPNDIHTMYLTYMSNYCGKQTQVHNLF
jgi:hypothetical protein